MFAPPRYTLFLLLAGIWVVPLSNAAAAEFSNDKAEFKPLFPKDGVPGGWVVRTWDNVKNPAPKGVHWAVTNGVLHGSEPRGTWLMSEKEYGNFVLEFEWRIGRRGNSGCALRSPLEGDPAFDGLELQMVDPRYFPPELIPKPTELTGGLYRAVPPRIQVFRPLEWNQYQITCRGSAVKVVLNNEVIQDLDLDEQTVLPTKHDGSNASALKERPRRGHIGFQELSREGGHVEIRNARIKVMN
jgi:hypothetical protein